MPDGPPDDDASNADTRAHVRQPTPFAATMRAARITTTAIGSGDRVASRYRIVRFVAAGGMGEVYEAEDLQLGGAVALKVVRRDVPVTGSVVSTPSIR